LILLCFDLPPPQLYISTILDPFFK